MEPLSWILALFPQKNHIIVSLNLYIFIIISGKNVTLGLTDGIIVNTGLQVFKH